MARSTITNPLSIGTLTPTFDTDKISQANAFRYGKITLGSLTVKSGVLVSGYNTINFHATNWYQIDPVASVQTYDVADDAANFYVSLSDTKITIRASKINTGVVNIYFIGISA